MAREVHTKLPLPGEPPSSSVPVSRTWPLYNVTLDAGAFFWVWQMIEARALVHLNNPNDRPAMEEHRDVSMRAALAFRESLDDKKTKLTEKTAQVGKKVIKRR